MYVFWGSQESKFEARLWGFLWIKTSWYSVQLWSKVKFPRKKLFGSKINFSFLARISLWNVLPCISFHNYQFNFVRRRNLLKVSTSHCSKMIIYPPKFWKCSYLPILCSPNTKMTFFLRFDTRLPWYHNFC